MRFRNVSTLALAFGLSASAQESVQEKTVKVGVINIQAAMVGTKDGKKATEELDKKFLPEQKEFDTRQNELIELQDQLSKGRAEMSEDKRIQLSLDIDEKKKRLEREMQGAEDDLKSQQRKVLESMAARMMAVLAQYSRDNGFSVILDAGNQNTPVLFAASGVDVTQDVIALYDKDAAKP